MNIINKNTCYYYLTENFLVSNNNKIAAFDLDQTLITTISGKRFPIDGDDWKWLFPNIMDKLQQLSQDNYSIVIFTNQKGVSSKKTSLQDLNQKFMDISDKLSLPIAFFLSSADDYYRKPCTGMWDFFLSLYPNDIDYQNSFYCGDAADRPQNWKFGGLKDFSSSDRYFAHNIGLQFYYPEQIFCDDKYILPDLPTNPLDKFNNTKIDSNQGIIIPKDKKVFLMMIGPPSSGKSTISKGFVDNDNWVRINLDTLKTSAKCLKKTKEALSEGKNIVIDNTNASTSGRANYLKLLESYPEYYKMGYYLDVPRELVNYLNCLRVQKSKGEIKKIPSVAYSVFYKKLEKPTIEEGFNEIIEINFEYKELDNMDEMKIKKPYF